MKHYNIPIFIPEWACPFQCIYCNQKVISGTEKIPSIENVISIIEKYLSTINYKNSEVEIAFFGGNFTGLPATVQKQYLEVAFKYITSQIVKSIRISTRPDYINAENLELLKKYNVKTIELGVQSLEDEVLFQSERGYKSVDVDKACKLIKNNEFELGLQMMVGLPGDTPQKSIETAKKIVKLGAQNTRIYPTLVIKNTELEKLFYQGMYSPLSLIDTITIVKQLIMIFENANIKVIKVGLHPSDNLTMLGIVAGPFHYSFRQLCETEIWFDIFTSYFNSKKISKLMSADIFVSPTNITSAVGYQTKNKIMLSKLFRKVRFIADEKLKHRDFYVHTYR